MFRKNKIVFRWQRERWRGLRRHRFVSAAAVRTTTSIAFKRLIVADLPEIIFFHFHAAQRGQRWRVLWKIRNFWRGGEEEEGRVFNDRQF